MVFSSQVEAALRSKAKQFCGRGGCVPCCSVDGFGNVLVGLKLGISVAVVAGGGNKVLGFEGEKISAVNLVRRKLRGSSRVQFLDLTSNPVFFPESSTSGLLVRRLYRIINVK